MNILAIRINAIYKIITFIALTILIILCISCQSHPDYLDNRKDPNINNPEPDYLLDTHITYADCLAGFNKPIIIDHTPSNSSLIMLSMQQEIICESL